MNTLRNNFIYLCLIACSCVLCLVPSVSYAYFSTGANMDGNTFTMGSLHFTTDRANERAALTQTGTTTINIATTNTGTIAPAYQLSISKGSCDEAFYKGIHTHIAQGSNSYSGMLTDALATSSVSGLWQLSFSAGSAIALQTDTCQFDVHIKAYQPVFAAPNIGGFTDEQTVSVTLTADTYLNRTVVLNEVLPNPVGDDWQTGVNGEWIEVYNTGSTNVDLNGWYVKDSAGNVIPFTAANDMGARTNIGTPGSGTEWVVLYMNGQILNNTGDTISLYDQNDVLHDQYTYGNGSSGLDPTSSSTIGASNGSTTLTGSGASATEGKSDARVPDGTGDWVDPIPTPGGPNKIPIALQTDIIGGASDPHIDASVSASTSTTTGTTTASTTSPSSPSATSTFPMKKVNTASSSATSTHSTQEHASSSLGEIASTTPTQTPAGSSSNASTTSAVKRTHNPPQDSTDNNTDEEKPNITAKKPTNTLAVLDTDSDPTRETQTQPNTDASSTLQTL